MKDNFKIAFVSGGLQFGGSTTFLVNLANGLKSLGVATAAFSFTRENPFAADFAALGVPVHTSDAERFIFEDRLTAIYEHVSRFNPAAVIANIGDDAYEFLRYVPQGVTRIGMVHDTAMGPRRIVPLYEDVLSGVAVVNTHLADEVKSAAPKVPCRYVAHGIPIPDESLVRDTNPRGPLRIIYFGRLAEGKGTRIFPAIIDQLHERQIPFRWTFHGTGPDEEFLRTRLSAEIAAGEVVMSSPVARDELFPIVRRHDVFIMASEIEGGPLTLLETMALGLVPVCNDIPCLIQEVIHPDNGFCIPREPRHYADSLAILHRNRTQLEQMSTAARKIISAAYSTQAMAERYLAFINCLASKSGAISWPATIKPKAIRGSALTRISQSGGIARQVRRLLKARKRST
ncbi:MAG TPA: glycosyltransferase [Verrucomicrobiae bacterium]|nr:glycosyltransferase [Verrucomicrobiae bacterium]